MKKNKLQICRICWYNNWYNIWWDDWKTPTFDICECCWVEFWYEDININAILNYRKKLFINSLNKNIFKNEQLNNIPINFIEDNCFMKM